MNEEIIKQVIINTIDGEQHLGENLKKQCLEYLGNLQQENQKYKEVIDKVKQHCEIEINASNYYLKNHNSQKELCHKVAHQRILDILKEVE